ncbi:MAG: excisionase [Pseudomonas sp.]|uniref:excisionase n=1 Tax=Pseudomonas sp. TaxID=306 RepID=UPI00121F9721|nr:excisionase [Pseudomonas sp.]RZI75172.1 MAG: excisionase [Pseudomonas sp.]
MLVPARFVTIKLAAALTGLSDKAISRKIEKGEWAEGLQYRRRDGRLYVDLRAYEAWVQGKR